MRPEQSARILIVDDDDAVVAILEVLLQEAGYLNVVSTPDPREVAPLFRALAPDLVLLDLNLPHISGLELLKRLRELSVDEVFLPILVMSGDLSPEAKRDALAGGARDFLGKPFDGIEALLRIRNQLETRFVYQALREQNQELADRVRQGREELEQLHVAAMSRLREGEPRGGRDSLLRLMRRIRGENG